MIKNAFRYSALAFVLCARQVAVASEITVTPLLDLRWRQEILDTLSANRALDHNYSYGNLRERFGGDVKYKFLTLHVLGQAADSYNVPNDASFGAGASYYSLSRNNSAPSQAALAELSLIARPNGLSFVNIGRQGIKDGAEPPSGNTRLDWIEDNRVSERLIGAWEWTNVARRFDGVSGGYNAEVVNVTAFGARILEGGLAYSDAFKPLDGVQTAGISIAAKPGVLVPKTEVRFFNISYRDYRPITDASLGDSLYLNTVGFDLVGVYPYGPGVFDALFWAAYQSGDYGAKTQSADAFLLEGGYGLPQAAWAPWLRAGVDYASGGSPTDGKTHTTFVNLAPTNHKFYGIQDLNAFQNLTDIFAQAMVQPVKSVKVALEDHLFRLSNTGDGWYSGSGPSNDSAFGIAVRPGAGTLSANIGNEIDLVTTWTPVKRLALQAGYSHFEGGSAARAVYPTKSVTNFLYFQTSFKY